MLIVIGRLTLSLKRNIVLAVSQLVSSTWPKAMRSGPGSNPGTHRISMHAQCIGIETLCFGSKKKETKTYTTVPQLAFYSNKNTQHDMGLG
jgi:hypothetical protein